MGLANINGPVQTLVIGLILTISIVLPVLIRKVAELRAFSQDLAGRKTARHHTT